jgi:GNAT superfamily N-acetyltransferase
MLSALALKIQQIQFIITNLLMSLRVKPIKTQVFDEYILRGATKSDRGIANELYRSFHDGKDIRRSLQLLYFKFGLGRKLVFLLIENNKPIGMAMYYFNKRDKREKTVHQGFTGVIPPFQGKGLATVVRRHALFHFKAGKLKGMSSRVSLDNKASLKSNEKIGFTPVEQYFDEDIQKERFYLICNFNHSANQQE